MPHYNLWDVRERERERWRHTVRVREQEGERDVVQDIKEKAGSLDASGDLMISQFHSLHSYKKIRAILSLVSVF